MAARVVAAIGAGLWAPGAGAQVPDPSGLTPDERRRLEALPAQAYLGFRVQLGRAEASAPALVVIARDPESYLRAVGSWTRTSKFPVLIDDGTPAAREDIARFVRVFKARRVVRVGEGGAHEWREPPGGEARAMEVLARALQAPTPRDGASPAKGASPGDGEGVGDGDATRRLAAFWASRPPVGIVVAGRGDEAWTGAVALAAFHGQALALLDSPGGVDAVIGAARADAFAAEIERACEATGRPWRATRDDVDAVTLAMNAPVKYNTSGAEFLALTDRVGRHASGERWAWCGMVHGTAAGAAYKAMSAAFLAPTAAWLFDGYPDEKPFDQWDATRAGEVLRKGGWTATVLDGPRQGDAAWRSAAAGAIDAGLVLVNSKGNSDFFEANPGILRACDVPMLHAPAIVHMVHSWSLQWPGRRGTVGGRWLERGAYAYAGSVHEPYLSAFQPTPRVVERMLAGAPWGVAVRLDGEKPWKIAVLGDPLIMLGPGLARTGAATVIDGASDVEEDLRRALKDERFDDAVGALVVLGRDADVRSLARALLAEKPGALSGAAGAAAVLALFRVGDHETLARVYARLDDDHARDGAPRDALWLAAYPRLATLDDAWLALLRDNLRPDNIERDATELLRAWSLRHGRADAIATLEGVASRLKDEGSRGAIDRAIKSTKR